MDRTVEDRLNAMERSNRRARLLIVVLGAALAGSIMLGLQKGEEEVRSIEGFSAIIDPQGTISYFRLVNQDTVQILDTTRGDRWFWRRIRNWPGR